MKSLAQLEAAYIQIDKFLDDLGQALKGEALTKLIETQVTNDQAYFLLCWGQLESEIDAKCRQAIRRRRSDPDWQIRRGWDLYNPDETRLSGLSFEDRAKLVLDQREGRGKPYAKTISHYGIRNRIAHGKLESTRLNVSAFIQDCYVIQTALHRSA